MKLRNFISTTIREYLNEKEIFEEIQIQPYKITKESDKKYVSYFNVNGLDYKVDIYHDDSKHKFGVYEVEFSTKNQKNAAHRTNKDLKHLNIVLYTVSEIIKEVVKNNNIKQIYIDSANDEFDINNLNTLRSDIYYRFLKNNFKNGKIERYGRFINLYFKNDEKYPKLEILKNILYSISNNYLDVAGIERGINGLNDNYFEIKTDYISNINVGDILFNIIVNTNDNKYSLEYEIYDLGINFNKKFNSFNDLVRMLKIKEKEFNKEI
jgi:hypothetical protein